MSQTIDANGGIHAGDTGRFTGHVQVEGDAGMLAPAAHEPMSDMDWMATFAPLESPSGSELWEAEELAALTDVTERQVWSVVDGDEGVRVVPRAPGSQTVNVIGFAVTAVEWDGETIEAEW